MSCLSSELATPPPPAPSPPSECPPLPPGSKRGGGQHSLAGERAGGANSDDLRESLAPCILCAAFVIFGFKFKIFLYTIFPSSALMDVLFLFHQGSNSEECLTDRHVQVQHKAQRQILDGNA